MNGATGLSMCSHTAYIFTFRTTERYIQQALSNVTKDRTTFVIAHRLSTIINANLILVIKDGRVAESGTHDELLKQGPHSDSADQGIYWEMWHKQLREDNDTDSASTLDETNKNEGKPGDNNVQPSNPHNP